MAQWTKARPRDDYYFWEVGSSPEFVPCFFFLFCFVLFCFFFALPFILFFVFFDKKNLFVELSRRTMLVKSAASTLASTFFLPSWTDCFFIDSINLLQIVSPVRQHDHRFYDHFAEWLENTQACHADIFLSSYRLILFFVTAG